MRGRNMFNCYPPFCPVRKLDNQNASCWQNIELNNSVILRCLLSLQVVQTETPEISERDLSTNELM